MNNFETIVLTKDELGDDLWDEVGDMIRVLCKAGYVSRVEEEERGIVVIRYNYQDLSLTGDTLEWLTCEEHEEVWRMRNKELYEDDENVVDTDWE